MPYTLVDVELTEPPAELRIGEHETGVGLVSRRHGHVVGFALHAVAPGSRLAADRLASMLDPAPVPADVRPDAGPRPEAGADPTITVAVCTKDRPELLRSCLDSVLGSDVLPLEVLVVDNAPSDDRTRDVVAALGLRYEVERCAGLDFARNRALRSARGDVVAFVDDDVVVDPDWLARVRAVWRDEPGTGAVTGQILPVELATDAQIAFEHGGGFRGGNERIRYVGQSRAGDPVYPYGPGSFGAGANMAVHRVTALEIGAFDEALDTGAPLPGGGDIDMLHRIVRHGAPLVYEPRAVVFHRHRRGTAELRRQYRSWGRSLMAYTVKTYRADPHGRPKLRRLVRWFFMTQARAAVRALAARDVDRRDAALSELAGGVAGLLGTYGRSVRRSARVRRTCAGPAVAVMATVDSEVDGADAPTVAGPVRRSVDALQRSRAEPVVVAWSTDVRTAVRRIDVSSGAPVWLVPAGPVSRRRWRYDAPTRALARVLRREACRVVLQPATVEARRVGVAAGLARAAVYTVAGGPGQELARWTRPSAVDRARVGERHAAVLLALDAELGRP